MKPAPAQAKQAVPSGATGRVRANLAALRTIRQLQDEQRPATPAETAALAGWSGWGAVPDVFDPGKPAWQWARDELAELLTSQETAAAARSTLNAHYTDPGIAAAVWETVTRLGFTGGRVLEPGCGSGNFIAAAPPAARMTGVELDPTTAAIARARCPQARIVTGSFADVKLAGMFDAVVGNVPFGNIRLHDPAGNPGRHSIHNHFIVKSLRLTRPGGIVAVVTSRYTLDSESQAARRDMHDLADLVAAVRLPSGAHQETAGTRVVTDLLVFRRREPGRQPAEPAAWLDTVQVTLDGVGLPVNTHFAGGPEGRGSRWVLGRMTAVHGAYRAGDLAVEAPKADLAMALRGVLIAAAAAAKTAGLTWQPPPEPEPEPARPGRPAARNPEPPPAEPETADGLQEGHILRRQDGRFARAENGELVQHACPASQARELAALLDLRDTALRLLDAEAASDADTPRLDAYRGQLRTSYSNYLATFGPLNRVTERRTGRTDPATGTEKMARVRPPMGGFRSDPHAPLVFALEEFDPESQTAEPAPLLTRRVVAPRTYPQSADSPTDALTICLDAHGRADLDVIAGLLGATPREAREALTGLVFDDPDTGTLLPAAEYLSGDVRARLHAAEKAAAEDARYEPNVAALRAVVPADLAPGEIDARLGAAWIPASDVQDFLREILDDTRLTVTHPGGQIWDVDGSRWSVRARSTWGTERYFAPDLARALLEQRRIEVRDPVDRPDGSTAYVLNVEQTAAAVEKAGEMQERFGEWCWEQPERAARLARRYNDAFNNLVLRTYDDAAMTLPGLSTAITLRKHQVAAVARIVSEPAVLLAHEVGAGKTLEMVCGVMELRRLGLVRKPCVVVPNHMLDQFAGEWLRAYPLARVLVTRQEDLQGDNRRRLVARAATGDWDGIIMSSSAFERIPLSPQATAAYLEREVRQFREWLENARQSKSRTVKRIEKALLSAEERVKRKLAGVKDPGISFEATGIDYLCVDEAHRYKNLRTPSSISDAAIDGSMRASDLDMKVGWLRSRNGSRVVTFATATPVANSMTEIYVMQKYLRPDLLEAAGIDVFDSWAATFGEVVTEVEMAPEGGGSFRLKSRFAKFRNVPELLRMFHLVADVKLADDLDLPKPLLAEHDGKRQPVIIEVPASSELKDYVTDLAERAGQIRARAVAPEVDNMLKVTGDGRKAALDLRLVGLPQPDGGKIAEAAWQIHSRWAANRDRVYPGPGGKPSPVPGALQLVFMDFGTPRPGWSAYTELRDQLAGLGVPRDMVRFIHDARTDREKAALFAACRAGTVAVLIGSTEKMGVGTNVQHRAVALHHLDAPWRPADVEQRDGRIMRQGNLNPEVEILRYVVTGSFDGYSWQILARKARFIGQVMRGRLDVREIEDVGDTALSFAEVKAIATGNPLLLEQARADVNLARLRRAERAHNRNQNLLKHTARDMARKAAVWQDEAGQARAAAARRVDTTGDRFRMTVAGREYDKRADAGARLAEVVIDAVRHLQGWGRDSYPVEAGTLAGFPVRVTARQGFMQTEVDAELVGAPGTCVSVSAGRARDGLALIRSLEYRAGRLEWHAEDAAEKAAQCRGEAEKAAEALDTPFPRAAELASAEAEAERIAAALGDLARKTEQAEADKLRGEAGEKKNAA